MTFLPEIQFLNLIVKIIDWLGGKINLLWLATMNIVQIIYGRQRIQRRYNN